jgi:hypothetical protein
LPRYNQLGIFGLGQSDALSDRIVSLRAFGGRSGYSRADERYSGAERK